MLVNFSIYVDQVTTYGDLIFLQIKKVPPVVKRQRPQGKFDPVRSCLLTTGGTFLIWREKILNLKLNLNLNLNLTELHPS
jgi:hypothetical protein